MSLLTLLRSPTTTAAPATQRLNLNFLTGSVDGNTSAINYTRPTTATIINQSGNIAEVPPDNLRLNHTETGTPQGLLIEPNKTNEIIYSNFDAGPPSNWNQPRGSTPGTTIDLVTWDKLGPYPALQHTQPESDRGYLQQVRPVPPGPFTVSLRVDLNRSNISGNQNIVTLLGSGVDFETRTLSDVDPNTGLLTIHSSADSSTVVQVRIGPGTLGNASGTLTWGTPQLETGNRRSSYIPTQGTPAVRAADSFAVDLNGLTSIADGVTIATQTTMLNTTGGIMRIANNGEIVAASTPGNVVDFAGTQFAPVTLGAYDPSKRVAISLTGTQAILANAGQTSVQQQSQPPGGMLTLGDDINVGDIQPQHVANLTIWTPNKTEGGTAALT